MASKPGFTLDLKARSNDSKERLPLPSPRFQHFDGDVPPALSPLDAFAAQSRLMAKQLDETAQQGRRASRLPPAMVSKSLGQIDRPSYFRAFSDSSQQSNSSDKDTSEPLQLEEPRFRPISEYPRFSDIPELDYEDENEDEEDNFITPMDRPSALARSQTEDYFTTKRSVSPENDSSRFPILEDSRQDLQSIPPTSHPVAIQKEKPSNGPEAATTLSPPKVPFSRPPNNRPHHESSDDDYTSSNAGSTFSFPRKLSGSSGVSSHSPISPFVPGHGRSESLNSETSIGGTHIPKPFLNFSRPLSSSNLSVKSDTQSLSRKQSYDTQDSRPSFSLVENPPTPLSMDDARSEASDGYLQGNQSYTYAKFSLPRGRMVSRNSIIFAGLSTPNIELEPFFHNQSHTTYDQDIFSKSTSSLPITESANKQTFHFDRPRTPDNPTQPHKSNHSPAESFHSATSRRSSVERGDLRTIRQPPPRPDPEECQSLSSKSNSTVRPFSVHTSSTTTASMTPDEHVAKGIESHERGSYKESTYHLRLAAMGNHPTGMLLYALACRHGWGMRANQREGVQWLRKAADCAVLEVVDDQDPNTAASDLAARKARRAQFALSIYELGQSHLHGWGIEQDKGLALRCFEIAGSWGDADALAEAGFCYAEGIGTKKDLKKAARFYRQAEAKGMSMVGNSWIYKKKYLDDSERYVPTRDPPATPEKKSASHQNKPRTRSRSIFRRKNSDKNS
ncbi:MAG: hypothetical protein Q9227_009485 [Pyrenula ochraceoflavens]